MTFVTDIIAVITAIFTGFVGPLGNAVVSMFEGLFLDSTGGLSVLGQGLVAFAAIAMVIGILYMAIGMLRSGFRRRV